MQQLSIQLKTTFLRLWVIKVYEKDQWYPPAFRSVDLENRCVQIHHIDSIEILYCNKTCMRNIEVAVLDEGKVYLI